MDIGSRIKKSRQKIGISQSELARRLEVAPSAVSHWEANRKTPEVKTLQRVANTLDTTISYLTTGLTEEEEIKNKIKDNVPLDKIAAEHTFTIKGEVMSEEDKMELLRFAEALMIMKKMKKD